MKRPTESDFEINVTGAGVEVIFKPTKSHYSYNRLVDQKDIARFGPISPARVRHAGATGDTGDYSSHDVEAMALRLAADAVSCASRRGEASRTEVHDRSGPGSHIVAADDIIRGCRTFCALDAGHCRPAAGGGDFRSLPAGKGARAAILCPNPLRA